MQTELTLRSHRHGAARAAWAVARRAGSGFSLIELGQFPGYVLRVDRDEAVADRHRCNQPLAIPGKRKRQEFLEPGVERFSRRLVNDETQPAGQRVDIADAAVRKPRMLIPRQRKEAHLVP